MKGRPRDSSRGRDLSDRRPASAGKQGSGGSRDVLLQRHRGEA